MLDTDKTTQLPHWLESYDSVAQVARLWVKTDLASSASKVVYLYSGNPTAPSKANGNNVFEFFDDFSGIVGWNRYAVTNPIVKAVPTTWRADIVGDPLVIPPDASNPRYGAFYFGANGSGGGIGYMEANADSPGWDGKTWVDKTPDPILSAGGTYDGAFAIKPSVFYEGGTYHMAYAGKTNGQNWRLLYATATNRMGPWTKKGILLEPNGSDAEGARLDCPCWFRDKAGVVRLYYSGHEAVANEPRNFCVATATAFAGPFTRYSGNPLARPNASIPWMETGLGGMSVRQLPDNSFDLAYNAFDRDGISRMGYTNIGDGYTFTLKAEDLMFDRVPGAWDAVKIYRPCVYDIGDGILRLLYNALGGTENIGYAEYTRKFDDSKWSPVIQGDINVSFSNGVMSMAETRTQSPGNYFTLQSAYKPANNTIVEVRSRLEALYDTTSAAVSPIILTEGSLFPGSSGNNQFLFYSKDNNEVRKQSMASGNWQGEKTIVASFPTVGAMNTYSMVKKAANIDWEVLAADQITSRGKISADANAPQGTLLPLAIGLHGAKVGFDSLIARKWVLNAPTISVGAPVSVQRSDL